MDTTLAQLVATVRASPKYRHVSSTLVQNIGAQELAKRRNLKEAIKATRNRLHQIAGAYLEPHMDYPLWLDRLRQAAQTGDQQQIRRICREIMSHHASTRERLPILDQFYAITLAPLAPVRRILDIACGLNPLAIPWMPLAPDAEYLACDIYEDMIQFIAAFMTTFHLRGQAQVCDVITSCPTEHADVALILKTLPCLEQIDRSACHRLLHAINADHLLVSFPVQSLCARDKGMAASYEIRFREAIARTGWPIQRFTFATELAFLITKQ